MTLAKLSLMCGEGEERGREGKREMKMEGRRYGGGVLVIRERKQVRGSFIVWSGREYKTRKEGTSYCVFKASHHSHLFLD